MSAVETLKKLMQELESPQDTSLSPQARQKLTEIFEKYLPADSESLPDHKQFHFELDNVVEKFKIEHPGVIDLVNILSNMGL